MARIAYLTSQYPTISHTFILREVDALRSLGLEIETCSVRRTPVQQHPGPAEKAEAARTFSILPDALNPFRLLIVQVQELARPSRYISTLLLALRTRPPGLTALFYQLIYFAEATVLARHLRKRQVTHLHAHFANACASVAMLTANLADLPFSFTLHGPSDLQEPRHWRLDEKITRSCFVACISHFARSQAMLNSEPSNWEKLKIIRCGVIPELYYRENAAPVDVDQRFHLVFVGRLAPVKGLRILLDALHILKDINLRLTIVGDGPDRAELEKLAGSLGDTIRFTGVLSQEDVAGIMNEADAIVLPSFAEGVPVVLMEAMASGKPVIATQVAGVSELVENGVNGWLVPAGDAESLARKIEHLADNPDERQRMGAKGRLRVQAEFDVRQEAARIATLFKGKVGTALRPEPYRPEG